MKKHAGTRGLKRAAVMAVAAISFASLVPAMTATAADDHVRLRRTDDGVWESREIAVEPGERFVYFDQYKSNVDSELDVRYLLSTGETVTVRVERFGWSKKWIGSRTFFAAPPEADSMTIVRRTQSDGMLLIKNSTLSQD